MPQPASIPIVVSGGRGQEAHWQAGGLVCVHVVACTTQTVVVAHVQAAWDGFDRGADPSARPTQTLAEWLPGFFEVVVAAADSESHWCAAVLPDQHPRLVLRLLAALFQRISKSFKSRLMSACATGESEHHCVCLHCCCNRARHKASACGSMPSRHPSRSGTAGWGWCLSAG